MKPEQPKVNKKLQQFLEEINELQDKYQYQVTPTLQITHNGILPTLSIRDKIPEKGKPKVKSVVKPVVKLKQ